MFGGRGGRRWVAVESCRGQRQLLGVCGPDPLTIVAPGAHRSLGASWVGRLGWLCCLVLLNRALLLWTHSGCGDDAPNAQKMGNGPTRWGHRVAVQRQDAGGAQRSGSSCGTFCTFCIFPSQSKYDIRAGEGEGSALHQAPTEQ